MATTDLSDSDRTSDDPVVEETPPVIIDGPEIGRAHV